MYNTIFPLFVIYVPFEIQKQKTEQHARTQGIRTCFIGIYCGQIPKCVCLSLSVINPFPFSLLNLLQGG